MAYAIYLSVITFVLLAVPHSFAQLDNITPRINIPKEDKRWHEMQARKQAAQEPPKVAPSHYVPEANAVRKFLSLPDEKIDLGIVQLTFDQLIDPSVNIETTDKQLNLMVEHINHMVKDVAIRKEVPITDSLKFKALRTFLFDSGFWNNNQAFSYDLEDPLGHQISSKLLNNYLKTRKGNCVSMPILMVILGQRLGLDMGLAKAPLHFLATFTDEKGDSYFVEATTGGYYARDSHIINQFNISDLAIQNHIYMRELTKKETVAAMASTMMDGAILRQEYGKSMYIADAILEGNPFDVYAMVKKASAAGLIIEPYWHVSQVPPQDIGKYYMFVDINKSLFEQAEALGWQEQTPEEEKKYLDSVLNSAHENTQL